MVEGGFVHALGSMAGGMHGGGGGGGVAGAVHGREACMVGEHVWWGACVAGRCTWQGGACMVGRVCMAEDMHGRGHTWQGGLHGSGRACMAGGTCMARRGHARQGGGVRGRRDGHCSGRYASYWKAFLFTCVSSL